MTTQQLLFLGVVFIVVTGLALLVFKLLNPNRVTQRVASLSQPQQAVEASSSAQWVERVARVAEPFAKLSLPEQDWEKSVLRRSFIHAGWRSPSAPRVYFGVKTALALGLPLLFLLVAGHVEDMSRDDMLSVLLVLAAVGYYIPNIVLSRSVEARKLEIFENFPDALDLLTVCVEAGLSLDNALTKVAGEIQIKSVILSQELQMVLIEMRAGFPKETALRNLAQRTGVEDVDTLVAMLIQSERFGTSMGESLRVHSESLRAKRRFRAEEAAAKIALKLLFPLIFFIFPTLLLVILGPAFIQIYKVLLPTFAAAGGG
ncbi:type II secretion system F family protein [Pseudomethylobacillus aquaticus]|uniref:Type II secretion system F family protein n=1 Tax=Pseudomethylobacillus aquaticus TaxID=2676064 RepID=A0A3N0UXX2_9PROT|nr:type II secretion system F family protein [Pseudomethylobacillus aquaticus]ROH85406.1 type II secretion system F family protein [Pseudomethylobacillus aquaticus]